MNESLNIYIAYAHEDSAMKNELEKHLLVLTRTGRIQIWSDDKILAGEKWDETISKEMDRADVILLLISPDFLASDFIWGQQLATILRRHQTGATIVIPILLRECLWNETPIANLEALPKGGRPISRYPKKDMAYLEIAREIERLADTFEKQLKWLQLIEAAIAGQSSSLDLSELGLTTIPDQVKEMTWLIHLNLSSNQISSTGGLETLTQLTNLNLSSNQIKKIEGLDGLKQLRSLILAFNQISKIEQLDNLTQLTNLDLSANQIDRIEGLDCLTQLTMLNLSSNRISVIERLEYLKILERLILSDNKIFIIQGVANLNELRSLYLHNNQISRIERLDKLPKLNSLYLPSNQISKIEGLDMLTDLEELDLALNNIYTIEGLKTLTKLKKLKLSTNKISEIAGLDVFPPSIDILALYGNPVKNLNNTIFGTSDDYNCINDLKNLFAEEIEINVPEVKLILTGNSDVGKTKFKTYLTTDTYDTSRNSTHGLEVFSYELDATTKATYDFPADTKITIWDFGGQEYFHNTHQLFFNENAVYIFLWEKQTNKNAPLQTEIKRDLGGNSVYGVLEHFNVDYWLSNIRHFANDASIILVQNKIDIYDEKKEPMEWLSYAFLKQYGCTDQYHISIAKSAEKNLIYWYDFQKLKYVIFSALKDFVSKNMEGNIYNQVRIKIETLKSVHYWKIEDFIVFIEDLKKSSTNLSAQNIDNRLVIEHFSRQGKVLYPTGVGLTQGNVIFTDPQWLSGKIYEILNDAVLRRNGFFDDKDLAPLVENNTFENIQILNQIIELMKQYNIIFYNPNKKQYVAPQYLPEVPTVHYSQVKKLLATPKLVIKVDGFLPKAVINNIIAVYALKDDTANFYKYGVKTETPNGTILLIEVDYPQKKIYIYTDSPEPLFIRDVFTEVLLKFDIKLNSTSTSTIEQTNKNTPSILNELQLITASNTKLYISIDDKIFVDWKELWNTHRSPNKNTERDYCIAEDGNMVLRKMFASYYLPYSEVRNIKISNQTRPRKLFISYSSKNTDFMQRFVTHLEPLKRNGTIELWYDRMIEPGTKWDDSIKGEMKNTDLVIFLLSPDFIATNYIFEFEIPQAIKQMESENSKLFFVELQECSWNKTVLSRFQQTTEPTADNKGVIIIGEAMNDAKWKEVIEALEKKIGKIYNSPTFSNILS